MSDAGDKISLSCEDPAMSTGCRFIKYKMTTIRTRETPPITAATTVTIFPREAPVLVTRGGFKLEVMDSLHPPRGPPQRPLFPTKLLRLILLNNDSLFSESIRSSSCERFPSSSGIASTNLLWLRSSLCSALELRISGEIQVLQRLEISYFSRNLPDQIVLVQSKRYNSGTIPNFPWDRARQLVIPKDNFSQPSKHSKLSRDISSELVLSKTKNFQITKRRRQRASEVVCECSKVNQGRKFPNLDRNRTRNHVVAQIQKCKIKQITQLWWNSPIKLIIPQQKEFQSRAIPDFLGDAPSESIERKIVMGIMNALLQLQEKTDTLKESPNPKNPEILGNSTKPIEDQSLNIPLRHPPTTATPNQDSAQVTPFDDDKAKTIKTMNKLREKWNLAHMQDLRRGKGEKLRAHFLKKQKNSRTLLVPNGNDSKGKKEKEKIFKRNQGRARRAESSSLKF
nr:hypothetical protein Iba_chr12dCG3360 [Ipomoea batatas]